MHDPLTVAWQIYIPLPRKRWKGKGLSSFKRIDLLTIWHKDPEKDGSDDSCAVSKRLTKLQREHAQSWGDDEGKHPWFRAERAKETQRPADAEALLRGALWHVVRAWRLDRWSLFHKRLTFAAVERLACELLHTPLDNVRSSLCLLPGWHTNDTMLVEVPNDEDLDVNSKEYDEHMDTERARALEDYPLTASDWGMQDCGRSFYWMIVRILKRHTARWWQHPKWHVWHWRFQVHLWQRFKRRFIERCDKCGVKFRGSTNVYSDWHGTRKWCADCQSTTEKPQTEAEKLPMAPGNADDGILR